MSNATGAPTASKESQSEEPSHSSYIEADTSSSEEGFLSFEDWKRLNRLRSAERVDDAEEIIKPPQMREAPHPRGHYTDQAVDSIGDDLDIQMGSSAYGKTSKERFNYASFDCAAAVLKSNPEAKGSSAILDENRDRYMLNKCGASNKFVIIEMCEDILVDTVVLANFEFFSSTFKEFRISVTDRYPIQERGWKTLGTFQGNNTRTLQVFAVENPLIWARYIRIEFLSHYGSEFYCPLSLLRIHGTTMMEEYKNQENAKQEEYTQPQEVVLSRMPGITSSSDMTSTLTPLAVSTASKDKQAPSVRLDSSASSDFPDQAPAPVVKETTEKPDMIDLQLHLQPKVPDMAAYCNSAEKGSPKTTHPPTTLPLAESESFEALNLNNTPSSVDSDKPKISPSTTVSSALSTSDKQEATAGITASVNPTTQESVYKTITKRLSLLEANATLSLRYIEEQSHLLRDVFGKMERRHGQKMDTFLSEMNATLSAQLHYFVIDPKLQQDLTGSANSTNSYGSPRLLSSKASEMTLIKKSLH